MARKPTPPSPPPPPPPLSSPSPFGANFRWTSPPPPLRFASAQEVVVATVESSRGGGYRLVLDCGLLPKPEVAQEIAHMLLMVALDPHGFALRADEYETVMQSGEPLDSEPTLVEAATAQKREPRSAGKVRRPFISEFKWERREDLLFVSADGVVTVRIVPERAGDYRLLLEYDGFTSPESARDVALVLLSLLVDNEGQLLDYSKFDHRVLHTIGGGRMRADAEMARKGLPITAAQP